MKGQVKKYKAAVLGAGNIGAMFDSPSQKECLTHAHAYKTHPDFELVGIFDSDIKKAEKAARLWKVPEWGEGIPRDEKFDVISVAVSDESHYPVLKQLAKKGFDIIFLEKPIANSIEKAYELKSLYARIKIPVCVNYRRRFVPEFEDLRKEIKNWGPFIKGAGYYGKGIIHNGSHMIDLLRYLVDEPREFVLFDYAYDYNKDDPSISAVLKLAEGGIFVMQYIKSSVYTIFEIDLFFEKARVRIIDSGFRIEIQKIVSDEKFKGYKNIEREKEYSTALDRALYYGVDAIARYLKHRTPLACTINDAMMDMDICARLAKAVRKNEKTGSFILS